MLSIVVHIVEVLTLVLVGYVAARVVTLEKRSAVALGSTTNRSVDALDNEQILVESPTAPYSARIEALKETQIFSGIQMIPVKREFTDFNSAQLVWLREAVGLYLIGASDYISKQAGCDIDTRNKFNALVLNTNLRAQRSELDLIIERATKREQGSDEELMIIAGAKAAKQWKETQQVNDSLKLRTRLNDWGVFA